MASSWKLDTNSILMRGKDVDYCKQGSDFSKKLRELILNIWRVFALGFYTSRLIEKSSNSGTGIAGTAHLTNFYSFLPNTIASYFVGVRLCLAPS
jgi:hypothetical protein